MIIHDPNWITCDSINGWFHIPCLMKSYSCHIAWECGNSIVGEVMDWNLKLSFTVFNSNIPGILIVERFDGQFCFSHLIPGFLLEFCHSFPWGKKNYERQCGTFSGLSGGRWGYLEALGICWEVSCKEKAGKPTRFGMSNGGALDRSSGILCEWYINIPIVLRR